MAWVARELLALFDVPLIVDSARRLMPEGVQTASTS
jgi:hypothetical protein